MKITIVAETFLPAMNGVTRSVLEVASHLAHRHRVVIIAPRHPDAAQREGRSMGRCPRTGRSWELVHVAGHRVPRYRELAVAMPGRHLEAALRLAEPDVVYAASPLLLGRHALRVANQLGVPAVAVHQTDLAGFARHYGLGAARPLVHHHLRSTYERARRVLVPSSAAHEALDRIGVEHTTIWPRGVDLEQFSPAWCSEALRRRWTGPFDHRSRRPVVVGYAGRLAAEKRLDLLAGLDRQAGIRLVIIGDGPQQASLRRRLPGATFTGHLRGAALSRAVASLDLFVHAGSAETFCQAIQEALASGVPVIAPDCGGPRDLVHPGVNGLRYRPGDRAALHRNVLGLAADGAARAVLAAGARPSVAERSWSAVCTELERMLTRIVAPGADQPWPRPGRAAA